MLEQYYNATPTEQVILQIIALYGESSSRTAVARYASSVGIRNEKGKSLTTKEIDPIIEKFPEYLTFYTNHIIMNKMVKPLIAIETLLAGKFREVSALFYDVYSAYSALSEAEFVRDLRILLFTNQFSRFSALIAKTPDKRNYHYYPCDSHILDQVIPTNRFNEVLPLFPEEHQHSLILFFLQHTSDVTNVSTLMPHFRALPQDIREANELPPIIVEYLLLQGNYCDIVTFSSEGSAARDIVNVMSEINEGSYQSAIKAFDTIRKKKRKAEENKTLLLDGIIGLMQIIFLMREQSSKSEKSLNAIFKKLDTLHYSWDSRQLLEDFRDFLTEGTKMSDTFRVMKDINSYSSYTILIYVLIAEWSKTKLSQTVLTKIFKITTNETNSKNRWISFQIISCLKAQGLAIAEKWLDENKSTWVPLIGVLGQIDSWEILIKQLSELGDTKQNTTSAQSGSKRCSWILQSGDEKLSTKTVTIQPIEQSLGKTGKWSKGRNIALSRLHKKSELPDYLTIQDRDIITAIDKNEYYDWNSYGKTFYVVNTYRAIPLLKDHPHFYNESALDTPIIVRELSPQLDIKESKTKIKVKMTPFPEHNKNSVIEFNSTADISFYRFTSSQKNIAKLITAKGAEFPIEAKSKLNSSLSRLVGNIAVSGEVTTNDESIKIVKCGTKPTIRIRPASQGISAEMVIVPQSDSRIIFKPGKGNKEMLTTDSGVRTKIVRNLKKELKNANEIIDESLQLQLCGDIENGWFCEDAQDSLELIRELRAVEKLINIEWPKGETIKLGREIDIKDMKISMNGTTNWLELDAEVTVDIDRVLTLQELIDITRNSSEKFIKLSDEHYFTLSRKLSKQISQLAGIVQNKKGKIGVNPLAALSVEDLFNEGNISGKKKIWNTFVTNYRKSLEKTVEIPLGFEGELREYQLEGFQWLSRLADANIGACLADDMGLGKTVQALCLLQERAENGAALIIAPTSLCRNWADEARRFTPGLTVKIVSDSNRSEVIESASAGDIILCSYGLMVNEEELITAKKWHTLILDEAQAIKNISAKRSKVAKKIEADFRMIATGTPIENHLGELWNLMDFLNMGILGSFDSFKERFMSESSDADKNATQKLRNLIRPFILRRLKGDVLEELPPKTETVISVSLTQEERNVYEAVRAKALNDLENGSEESNTKFTILAHIMKLRRACCNSSLVTNEPVDIDSSKLNMFAQKVEELRENGHRALVFSQFVDHLSIIKEYCDSQNITYQYLDGSTSAAKRKTFVDEFQQGKGELFLISLKAGGVGLNLTAADYVFIMDPWWNPAVEDQAADRSHRFGQERPVTIYRMVAENSIEEKIVKLHSKKRSMADSLLEGTDTAKALSEKDLMELLSIG